MRSLIGVGVVLSATFLLASADPCGAQNSVQGPVLQLRKNAPAQPVNVGTMAIDVVVTDKSGKAVTGLGAQDFELSDNKQVQKVLSFSSVEQTVVKTQKVDEPGVKVSLEPAEVLLVVDTVNIGQTEQGYVREQAEKFLRSKGGKLSAPSRLFFFTSAGLKIQNKATMDGNALADLLLRIGPAKRVQNSAQGADGEVERFQLSLQNFNSIVTNETKQPGRKLLIWLGPAWPIIPNARLTYSETSQARNYDAIVSLLNGMREARMEVFSVRGLGNSLLYESYLKPVKRLQEADSGDLAVQVLAVKSGGRVTDPTNDWAGEIQKCVDDAHSYYTLRYTPSEKGKPLAYHSIDVKVNRPGVVVRNVAGYYEQP